MNTQEAAGLATREANPVIDGRKANVNLAYLGAKPRVIPTPAGKNLKQKKKNYFYFSKYLSMKINHTYKTYQTLLSSLIIVQAA